MPWFRFTADARVTLRYRNGSCTLGFAVLKDGENVWAWVATRDGSDVCEVLVRCGNVAALHCALADGFEVPAGSVAERIMLHVVRAGLAEMLPDAKQARETMARARKQAVRS